MVNPASGPRRIVLRANRETLVLVAAACGATFTLSYAIHIRPSETAAVESVAPQREWAGHLAEILPDQSQRTSTEPMTSASLVVPKSALAWPTVQARSRFRTCEGGATCNGKVTAPVPHARPSRVEVATEDTSERSLVGRLNPLNHLPNMSALSRPFAYAGNAISGWIDRF